MRKTLQIRTRLILTMFALTSTLVFMTVLLFQLFIIPWQIDRVKQQAEEVIRYSKYSLQSLRSNAIEPLLVNLKKDESDLSYIVLLDQNGKALYHSDPSRVGMLFEDSGTLTAIRHGRRIQQIYIRDHNNPKSPYYGEKVIDIITPYRGSADPAIRAIDIGVSLKRVEEIRWRYYHLIAWIGFLLFVICMVVTLIQYKAIISPLREISLLVRSFKNGNLDAFIPKKREDELGELAEEFNSMIHQIATLLSDLKQHENELQEYINQLPDFNGKLAVDGSILTLNKSAQNALEQSPDELIGGHIWEGLWWGKSEETRKHIQEAVMDAGKGIASRVVEEAYRLDNSRMVLDISIKPVFDLNQTVSYLVAEARDITARKEMEEKLQNDEALLQTLIASLPLDCWACDRDGTLLFQTEFSRIFWGDRIGQRVQDLNLPSEIQAVWDRNRIPAMAGKIATGDISYIHQDGRIHYYQNIMAPIFVDADIVGIVGADLDFTDLKNAQDALKNSEQKLQDIISFLPDPTFVIDQDGRVIAWNLELEKLTGIPASNVIGKKNKEYSKVIYGVPCPVLIDLILHPDPDTEKKYIGFHREGDAIHGEAVVHSEKNKSMNLLCKATPLYDSAGNKVGAIESLRDITVLRKMGADLQFSEEKYRNLVEALNDWVWEASEYQRFTYSGPQSHILLGYSSDEMIGRDPLDFADPSSAQRLREFMQPYVEKRVSIPTFEIQMIHKDGHIVTIEVSGTPIFDLQGAYRGYRGVGRDISEKKRVEKEMRIRDERERRIREESELAKRTFYQQTLLSVTDGKLNMIDMEEIYARQFPYHVTRDIKSGLDLPTIRTTTEEFARKVGMEPKRIDLLVMAVGEATANVVKHAQSGEWSLGVREGVIQVSVRDYGPGIDAKTLPQATLMRGFSTKVSLGLGFSLMLSTVDRIYLATDNTGTWILLEMEIQTPDEFAILQNISSEW